MNYKEQPRIFDEQKTRGIHFRLSVGAPAMLWPQIVPKIDDIVAFKLTRDIDEAKGGKRIGRPRPFELWANVKYPPVEVIKLNIYPEFKDQRQYQIMGRVYFTGNSPEDGVFKVMSQKDALVDKLKEKGVNAQLEVGNKFPWELTLLYDGKDLLKFSPEPGMTGEKPGGMAIFSGVERAGTTDRLALAFPGDMSKFLLATAYVTDALHEVRGGKTTHRDITFNIIKA